MTTNAFVRQSLDLNLFFLRIMKEHGLFIAVSFPPKYDDLILEATRFNTAFNELLSRTLELASGVVDIGNDAVTDFTLQAEEKTAQLSGFPIDFSLTKAELKTKRLEKIQDNELKTRIAQLNTQIISLTRNFIRFKTKVLNGMLSCEVYSTNYPLLLDHIRREAILYVNLLSNIQANQNSETLQNEAEEMLFWNQIMEEHSEFIRGLLDPTETTLLALANDFAIKYEDLNKRIYTNVNDLTNRLVKESIKLTKENLAFLTQGATGILNCEIKSIIIPLLGDHVIRETNHYLSLLDKIKV